MRKGGNPWDSKPSSSSCSRDGGPAGRMDPSTKTLEWEYFEGKKSAGARILPPLAGSPTLGAGGGMGTPSLPAPRLPGCSPSGASLGRAAGNSCRRAEI